MPSPDNTFSTEDKIGPHWSEPYGCCFGECDTEFSLAFREYHGLTEAWEKFYENSRLKAIYDWKKHQRKPPHKHGWQINLDFCYPQLKSKHMLPRRLRWIFKF